MSFLFNNNDAFLKDMDRFDEMNNFTNVGGYYMSFATLVESRITNNLMLVNNPELCLTLGINVASLHDELEELFAIRQKITFGKAKEKTNGR